VLLQSYMGRANAARARAGRALAGLVLTCAFAFAPPAHAEDITKKPPLRSSHLFGKIGALTLSLSYAPMGVMGVASAVDAVTHFQIQIFCDPPCNQRQNDAAELVIPIIGPLLYASPEARDAVFRPHSSPDTAETALLLLDATAQLAGVIMIMADAFVGTNGAAPAIQAKRSDDWTMIPSASPQGGGLLLSRTF
jgi:hypothetical protein